MQDAQSSEKLSTTEVLVDTGATASAGGEAAVRALVADLARVAPGASVQISRESRPTFLFGDGKSARVTLQFGRL
eukprot:13134208-Alexandrium_andersonii.AAC.1